MENEHRDNVIAVSFTKSGVDPLPTTLEQSAELIYSVRETHVLDAMELLSDVFFRYMEAAGFDFSRQPDVYCKDVVFFTEALRSLLSKVAGVEHPMQRIADEVFTVDGDDVLWTATSTPTTERVVTDNEKALRPHA